MNYLYAICKGFTDPVFVIFFLLIVAFILCFTGSKKKSCLLVLGLAILFLYGVSITPVANYLAYSLEKDYLHKSVPIERNIDVIVVLGGGAYDVNDNTFVSGASAARLLRGLEVFQKYGAKYFICVGKGAAEISEGEVMAQKALAMGVPREKIRIDAKSTNTWEHATELNKMFTNKNIYIGIVTCGYHMKRSEREFKKYFRNVVPFPASYSYSLTNEKNILKYVPQEAALNGTATMLREFIGSVWYEIKGM